MKRTTKLSLLDVPWPVNILTCKRRLEKMRPGEKLLVSLTDPDAKENLVMLLKAAQDCAFSVSDSEGCYLLTIKKRPAP